MTRGVLISVVVTMLAALGGMPSASASEGADDPQTRFFERLETLEIDDREAVLGLATWAFERGLLDEAEALFRLLLERDPLDQAAWASLWHVAGSRPLPKRSVAYDEAIARLGDRAFREHETPRYVILSDADPAWVGELAERLEHAYDRFIRFANQLDLRPLPLRHRLVAVVFEQFDDFAEFATADGNRAARRIAGYYSPRADRLVFYHVESRQSVAAARAELETEFATLESLRDAARRLSSVGRRDEARELEQDLETRLDRQLSREQRLDRFARRQAISVTVHEAIHQLMFHTGVQSKLVQQPLWLSEGLATAFETDSATRSFGPFREHWPRRDAFIFALERDELLPLRRLIVLDGAAVHREPGRVGTAYAQSYALMTWMCRTKKLELRTYLRTLNAQRGRLAPARQVELFESAFGDLDRLERMWLRHERNRWLQTP